MLGHEPVVLLGDRLGLAFDRVAVGLGRLQFFLEFRYRFGLAVSVLLLRHVRLGRFGSALGLFQGRLALGRQRRLQGHQGDEALDDEAEEQGDAADVEVALGPEQAHVGLHLVVEVLVGVVVLRVRVLAHLADAVQQEQDEYEQQEREVPLGLRAERLVEPGPEQAVPPLGRHVRHQEQREHAHLEVQERRDYRPLETHGDRRRLTAGLSRRAVCRPPRGDRVVGELKTATTKPVELYEFVSERVRNAQGLPPRVWRNTERGRGLWTMTNTASRTIKMTREQDATNTDCKSESSYLWW